MSPHPASQPTAPHPWGAVFSAFLEPGVLSATVLNDNLDQYTVIDLRSEYSFLEGHIPGAYHSSLATLLDDLATTIPADRPYVLAGYTGQTEGVAKLAMEMMGYGQVRTLLWGMSAWNGALDHWTAQCQDYLINPETTDQNPGLTEHAFPVLEGDPDTIITQRVTFPWPSTTSRDARSAPCCGVSTAPPATTGNGGTAATIRAAGFPPESIFAGCRRGTRSGTSA